MDPNQHEPGATVPRPSEAGTRWSLVHAAGDSGSPRHDEALEELGRRYWPSLYAYARRLGHSHEDAGDSTQGFLGAFLRNNAIARADPARGRFRTFLLTCFRNYIQNEWNRGRAARRGGGCERVSMNDEEAELRYEIEAKNTLTPDQVFDRLWSLATLERALATVRTEYLIAGKGRLHDELRGLLWENQGQETYAGMAERLGMTQAAVKMAVLRLRRRCRQALLDEVARTVADRGCVEDEFRCIIEALRG